MFAWLISFNIIQICTAATLQTKLLADLLIEIVLKLLHILATAQNRLSRQPTVRSQRDEVKVHMGSILVHVYRGSYDIIRSKTLFREHQTRSKEFIYLFRMLLEKVSRCRKKHLTAPHSIFADISVIAHYGYNVPELAYSIQQTVKQMVESMTKFKMAKIDVHIQSVVFAKNPPPPAEPTESEGENKIG